MDIRMPKIIRNRKARCMMGMGLDRTGRLQQEVTRGPEVVCDRGRLINH